MKQKYPVDENVGTREWMPNHPKASNALDLNKESGDPFNPALQKAAGECSAVAPGKHLVTKCLSISPGDWGGSGLFGGGGEKHVDKIR